MARITSSLTRQRRRGMDTKRILAFVTVSLLAVYRILRWMLFPIADSTTTLSELHHTRLKHSEQQLSDSLVAHSTPISIPSKFPLIAMDEPDSNKGTPLEGSIQRRQNFRSRLDPELPKWIRDYVQWHRTVREEFPGNQLFENPKAPNVLIRTCLGLCGGLHDRLGQLPWDLYLANQTKRVLFVKWFRPKPIEDFLIPNALNWSMPPDIQNFDRMQSVKHEITDMFEGTDDSRPEADFWTKHLDRCIKRANHGEYTDVKILRHRILGHLNEDVLEARLQALGETDMIHNTPSFGKLFFMFFHPAPAIELELEDVYSSLRIKPGQYSAVHCRVRHPKAFSKKIGV